MPVPVCELEKSLAFAGSPPLAGVAKESAVVGTEFAFARTLVGTCVRGRYFVHSLRKNEVGNKLRGQHRQLLLLLLKYGRLLISKSFFLRRLMP